MMTRPQRWFAVGALLIVLVAADQVTKEIAIAHLKGKAPICFPASWAPNDLFRFQYAENTGAFLSLGSRLADGPRFWLLTALNIVILAMVGVVLLLKRVLSLPAVLALSLVLSGGIGNIIDRLFRDGRVVDYMNLGVSLGGWSLRTGIFNIADLAIVGGLLILVFQELLLARTPKPSCDQE